MLSRSRSALASYEAHHGPNMTPMVDVVMVILIFFMASTVVMGPEWFLRSGLPRKGTAVTTQPQAESRIRVRLSVDDAGATRVSIDAGPNLSPADAVLAIRQRAIDPASALATTLLIDVDDQVPYADVVTIHEAAAAVGITKVGVVPK